MLILYPATLPKVSLIFLNHALPYQYTFLAFSNVKPCCSSKASRFLFPTFYREQLKSFEKVATIQFLAY
jgi:hypothetical protein